MYAKGTPSPNTSKPSITDVIINLQTTAAPKSPFVGNETYSITVTTSQINIEAYDLYGCSRALATLT